MGLEGLVGSSLRLRILQVQLVRILPLLVITT